MTPLDHLGYMKRALKLARRGAGLASPNPMVGAVIVRAGEIVGEGYHVYARQDHAEVLALRQAGNRARGSDMYVTLEPCSHFGRTPPCVEAVIESGVRRVFIAVGDPNPLVSGRGIRRLGEAGVEVVEGFGAAEATALNEKFFHFIRTGRPFVLLKLAMSLDGRIATCSGESRWITGPEARSLAHRMRFESDGVLIGIRTLLIDDPLLTVRGHRTKPVVRIVLDSELQTPPTARLFQAADPVIIFHRPEVTPTALLSAECVPAKRVSTGLDWDQVLAELGRRRMTSVLIEGGARVAASALRQGVVDKLALFYGSKLIGGDGLAGIDSLGVRAIDAAIEVTGCRARRVGAGLLVEGYPARTVS